MGYVVFFNETHHKPLEELLGTFQIHVRDLHKVPQHALLWGGHVLVELLGAVVELLLPLDVLTGHREELHCQGPQRQHIRRDDKRFALRHFNDVYICFFTIVFVLEACVHRCVCIIIMAECVALSMRWDRIELHSSVGLHYYPRRLNFTSLVLLEWNRAHWTPRHGRNRCSEPQWTCRIVIRPVQVYQ